MLPIHRQAILSISRPLFPQPNLSKPTASPCSQKQERGEISRVILTPTNAQTTRSINLFKALPSLNGNILELEKGGKKESRQKAEKKKRNKSRPHQRLVSLFECTPLMLKHENRMGCGDVYAFAMLSRYVSPSRYMRCVESLC